MARLYSYDLVGQNRQSSNLLMQPGLVDIKTGFALGGQTLDLVAVAEAGAAHVRIFTLDRASPSHTGVIPDGEMLEILRHARGRYGSTLDYLLETAACLRERGIRDREIERLERLARRIAPR